MLMKPFRHLIMIFLLKEFSENRTTVSLRRVSNRNGAHSVLTNSDDLVAGKAETKRLRESHYIVPLWRERISDSSSVSSLFLSRERNTERQEIKSTLGNNRRGNRGAEQRNMLRACERKSEM